MLVFSVLPDSLFLLPTNPQFLSHQAGEPSSALFPSKVEPMTDILAPAPQFSVAPCWATLSFVAIGGHHQGVSRREAVRENSGWTPSPYIAWAAPATGLQTGQASALSQKFNKVKGLRPLRQHDFSRAEQSSHPGEAYSKTAQGHVP